MYIEEYMIKAITPTNIIDKDKMKYLLESTETHKIPLHILGVGKEFKFLSKIFWLAEYLNTIENDKTIIVYTDAYDVFYIKGLEDIKKSFVSLNKDIIFSSERCYWHQLDKDKPLYDKLGKGKDYRYLNTGGVIGYVGALRNFFNDLIKLLDTNWFDLYIANEDSNFNGNRVKWGDDYIDQMIISHYITRSLDKYNVGLDYDADIFYTPVEDWDEWDNEKNTNFTFSEDGLQLHRTESSPCIVHVPALPGRLPMLEHLYRGIYE
jgi:hypothetical protein